MENKENQDRGLEAGHIESELSPAAEATHNVVEELRRVLRVLTSETKTGPLQEGSAQQILESVEEAKSLIEQIQEKISVPQS